MTENGTDHKGENNNFNDLMKERKATKYYIFPTNFMHCTRSVIGRFTLFGEGGLNNRK